MTSLTTPQIITLVVFFLWAMSGSKLGVFIFIIYLFYIFTQKLKIINISKLLNNNPMAEVYEVNKNKFNNLASNAKRTTAYVVIAVLVIIFLINAIVVVEAGLTGVYSLFGKVRDNELRSGIHLINPLAKVIPMSIRTEEYTMSIITDEGKKTGADSIEALTKEGLKVDLDITVLYHLNEDNASDIYKNVGLNYEEKVIRPGIRSVIREVIAQYEAKDIYSEKRNEAALQISEQLVVQMEPRGIGLEEVLLRNIQLPANLAQSIQEKLQAEQEAEKYDFLVAREKKEKERKIIEAEGQRDAQTIINRSLTTNYLYFLYISQLKDRAGTIYVPTSPSTGMPLFRNVGQ